MVQTVHTKKTNKIFLIANNYGFTLGCRFPHSKRFLDFDFRWLVVVGQNVENKIVNIFQGLELVSLLPFYCVIYGQKKPIQQVNMHFNWNMTTVWTIWGWCVHQIDSFTSLSQYAIVFCHCRLEINFKNDDVDSRTTLASLPLNHFKGAICRGTVVTIFSQLSIFQTMELKREHVSFRNI